MHSNLKVFEADDHPRTSEDVVSECRVGRRSSPAMCPQCDQSLDTMRLVSAFRCSSSSTPFRCTSHNLSTSSGPTLWSSSGCDAPLIRPPRHRHDILLALVHRGPSIRQHSALKQTTQLEDTWPVHISPYAYGTYVQALTDAIRIHGLAGQTRTSPM